MKPHSTQLSGLIFIQGKVFLQLKVSKWLTLILWARRFLLFTRGTNATSDISLNGDFVNLKSESSVDSFVLNGKELGKLTNNNEVNHIEANAANALIEAFFHCFKSLSDDENANQEMVSEILKFMG